MQIEIDTMKRRREIKKVGFTMGSHGSYTAALLLLCFCSLQTGGRASLSDSFASQQRRNDGRLLRQRRMAYHTYKQGQETTDGNIFARSSLTKEEFITQNRHSPNEKQLQVRKETYTAKGDENEEISSRTDLVQTGLTKAEFIQQHRNPLRQKPATFSAKVLLDKPAVAGELPTAKENENLVRVIVEYRDMFGKEIALQHAYALHHDLVDEKSIVIEVTEVMAEKLKKNRLIANVQEDSIWKEQGYLERIVEREELENGSYWKTAPGRSVNRLRERQLEEIIPYGISMIQADQLSVGPHPVTVCAVDTGLAVSHPDIDENRADGIDRESNVNQKWLRWNNDTRGHGTHIVGTLAAKMNNDLGVRGVGNLNVFVTRGLNNMGSAYESDIREAMEQCENAGAKIINLSLGGDKMSDSMKVIIDRLFSKGFLIFAAAGNEGKWRMEYPASDPHVVSVGALDSTGWFWANSNFGPTLEIMAPGHKILSTTVNSTTGEPRYAEYSGTSMAAPHVSGAAALLWSHFPNCTNQQIRYSIAYTAKDKGYPKCDQDFGFGVLQVKDAFDFLAAHPCEEANWGQNVGSGNCSTIDSEPMGGIPVPATVLQETVTVQRHLLRPTLPTMCLVTLRAMCLHPYQQRALAPILSRIRLPIFLPRNPVRPRPFRHCLQPLHRPANRRIRRPC